MKYPLLLMCCCLAFAIPATAKPNTANSRRPTVCNVQHFTGLISCWKINKRSRSISSGPKARAGSWGAFRIPADKVRRVKKQAESESLKFDRGAVQVIRQVFSEEKRSTRLRAPLVDYDSIR